MRKKNLRYMILAMACCAAFSTGCGITDAAQTEAAAETAETAAAAEADPSANAGEAAEEPHADDKTAEGTADPDAAAEENAAGAEGTDGEKGEKPEGEPPAKPEGEEGAPDENGAPPAKPDGEGGSAGQGGPDGAPPDAGQGGPGGPSGPGGMGTPPDGAPGGAGGPGGGMGMPPGGGGSQPESYSSLETYDKDTEITGREYTSTGKDENAILVEGGTVSISDAVITRTSEDSTGGDSSSFYGVGAAALCTDGTLKLSGSEITSDAAGGAGVFAYGDGIVYVSDTTISTEQDTSGGIHAAGGGTLYADNVTAVTNGASSAAVRSDRGGGTMVVTGGSYTSNGSGSPAVYCTADIKISNADLTATGSEAVCIEGLNSLQLTDCNLSGSMPDDEQNDHSWTVIVYQSMSGDSEIGRGTFTMSGGTLTSTNGGLFYTTNTESEFNLSNVRITAAKDSEYFLQCTGNANERGWGQSGANGADCTFNATKQSMEGDVIWDSISTLDFYLKESSALAGAFINDESWTGGTSGDGHAALYIDASSIWIVTGDSTLTSLENKGIVVDPSGNLVTIQGTDGTVYVEGDSSYTVTVESYAD